MTKKQLNELVFKSYSKGILDEKKAKSIAAALARKELKEYIKALKNNEDKNTVVVSSAISLRDQQKKMIKSLFPGKKILYNTNESLIAGIRIRENDILYEMDFKDSLTNLLSHVSGVQL
ncbi:MAG: F0F1 ATP synthase subunit delta [Candidatus Levybacteria bacterium]|nr:F0F1 ATP synthase subunit delta [Candidatus Levybacteria bacterium]